MTAEEATDLATEILDVMVPDLPERAEDFADSVKERAEGIRDWIIEHNHVTPAQVSALENMREACVKWMR